MFDVFTWWLAIQILGLAALPITLLTLKWLPDRGYVFAKPLGLLLAGYGVWLLGFAGLLPTNRGGWIIALAMVGAVSALLIRNRWPELRAWLSANRRTVITLEVVFAAGYLLWAIVRAYNPEIAGTEKPMDFAFINGVLRSERFPPLDPWLAGHSISYYYFGHLLMAGLVELSGVRSAVGFNLALAALFGLTAAGAFSLASSLVRLQGARFRTAAAAGLLAAVLLVGVSNLQGAAELIRLRGIGTPGLWQWVGVNGALEPESSPTWQTNDPGWWWWRATRVINTLAYERDAAGNITRVDDRADYTITEFPFFSFMLGDLHPHVMALPFGLLALALALNALLSPEPLSRWTLRRRVPEALLTALALGSLGFLNSWDFPTYGAIYLLAVAAGLSLAQARERGEPTAAEGESGTGQRDWLGPIRRWWDATAGGPLQAVAAPPAPTLATAAASGDGLGVVQSTATPRAQPKRAVRPSAGQPAEAGTRGPAPADEDTPLASIWRALWPVAALVGLGGALLYLPFYLTFRTQASGILPVTGPGTRGIHFVLIWGLFVIPAMMLLVTAYRRGAFRRRWAWLLLPALPLGLWSTLMLLIGRPAGFVADRWLGSAGVLLVAAVGLAIFADRVLRRAPNRALTFACLLTTVAAGLVLGCELFFVRDVFGNRMNTVFKLYYQAWILLAIAGSTSLYCALAGLRGATRLLRALRWLGAGAFAILLAGSLYYPAAATYTKAGKFRGEPTLDGLAFVQRSQAGEYDAVDWLNRNVRGPAVIVEAVGGQYSEFGRISARTGLPTIIGWAGHEVQWRGSDVLFRGREGDVEQIYRSADRNAVSALLRKYDAQYVVVGPPERAKYGPSIGQKFEGFMDVAYRNPDVTIFKVRS